MSEASASSPPLISARGLTKTFGTIRALKGVGLNIRGGRVHGLVGANGAGKSTFLNVLGGVVSPDSGSIEIDGQARAIGNPREAARLGFSFIYQELALIPQFSAFENMTMSTPSRTPFGLGDRPRRLAAARAVAERLHLKIDLRTPVRQLSIAERGLVAIGRALVGEARFVAMDEPTAALSDAECERLFAIVRELKASGVAIAYVSHRLDEVEQLCDDVTVFNDGAVVDRFARGNYNRAHLIRGITGKATEPSARSPATPRASGPPILTVEHLARPPRVRDVSFHLHAGEILGLAGLMGAGRTEILRLIFGADRPSVGAMRLGDEAFAPRDPPDAIARGIGLVPEERRSQALVMKESVAFNMNTGAWRACRIKPWLPLIDERRANRRSAQMADLLLIKAKGAATPVGTLSGGNQQKVVFGRWLLRQPGILLLDEPTRGVDVGARAQIWRTVEDYAAQGGAAIVVSSDLEELSVCHRVVVIVEGRDVGTMEGSDITEDRMLAMIYDCEGSHVW